MTQFASAAKRVSGSNPANPLDREPRCRDGDTQNGNRRTARARSEGEDRAPTHAVHDTFGSMH